MLGSVLTFMYVAAKILIPCLPPIPLYKDVLTTDQYLGKWYYVGVASWDKDDIAMYKPVDNSVVELKKSANDTLIMTGALREGDECVKRDWTYKFDPELDYVMDENGNVGIAWNGKDIKCQACLIVGKIHPVDGYFRFMLFARSEKTSPEIVEGFKGKMGCFGASEFVIAPHTKEFCSLEG